MNRSVASKKRTFFPWLATTTALIDINHLLMLDDFKSIIAAMLSNCKAGGKFGACFVIYKKLCESSISWVIWAYKIVCLLGVILKKDQETWLPACNSSWFWGACYFARSCRQGRSFCGWYFCYELASKTLVRGRGFDGRRSSILRAWKIVFMRILTSSKDWYLLYKKYKGDIRN